VLALSESPLLLGAKETVLELWSRETVEPLQPEVSEPAEIPVKETPVETLDFTDNGRLSSDNSPFFTRAALFVNGKQVTDLVIPDGVKEIKPGTFNGASGIKTLTVPASVEKIGTFAFAGCADLEEINLTNGLVTISDNAFAVTAIKTLTIPATVEYVGADVVVECENLTNVYFTSTAGWTTWLYSSDYPVTVTDSKANAELMKSYDNYHYQKNANN